MADAPTTQEPEPVASPPTEALPLRQMTVRRSRDAQRLVWLGIVLFFVLLPTFAFLLPGLVAVLAAVLGAGIPWVQAARISMRSMRGGTLTLRRGRALSVFEAMGELRLAIPHDEVLLGYEAPNLDAAVLHLKNGSQIVLRLGAGGPKRVLDHLGVGPAERALTLPLRRVLGAFTIGFMSIWPLLVGFMVMCRWLGISVGFGPLFAIIATVQIVRWLGFPRVVIGLDGIRVLGVLRPRFIPYRAVANVKLNAALYANASQAVDITLVNGKTVTLPTIGAPRERLEGIAKRIEEAARAHSESAARRIDVLARGDRTFTAWKEDVTRLALAAPTFRAQALEKDDFERVVLDASAPVEERLGAAMALRAIDPEGAQPRIRVAADASADEGLRDALAATADDQLDDALFARATMKRAR